MDCQYCGGKFATEKILKTHQKSAKYCIRIQRENIENVENNDNKNNEEDEYKYICEYCNKDFTHKHRLNSHYNNCIEKIFSERDSLRSKQLDEMKEKLMEMKEQLMEKDKQIEKLQNTISEIAMRSNTQITNNTNHNHSHNNNNTNNIVVNNEYRLNIHNVEKMNKMLDDHLTGEVLSGGQRGIARMVKDKFLTGPNGEELYKCVDASRHNFEYVNEEGYVERDVKAHKLKNTLVKGNICEKAVNLGLRLWMREDGSTDETQYRIYGNKVIEVANMSYDDSKFRAELSALTSL